MSGSFLDLPERLQDKIEPEPMSGCWLWSAGLHPDGYAQVKYNGRYIQAHRLVYELLIGPIPKPTLDHKCRVRCCVNPAHMTPMTMRENTLAAGSLAPAKRNATKTECPKHGTPYFNSMDRRRCRKCERIKGANYRARKKERALRAAC